MLLVLLEPSDSPRFPLTPALSRKGRGGKSLELSLLFVLQRPRGVLRYRHEAHGVAGFELAGLPEVGLDDGGRADEAAEAGAVGAEDNGEVAGEVDGADGVGVVVDVGGVESRL